MGVPVVGTFHASVDSTLLLRLARPWLRSTLSKLTRVVAVSDAARETVKAVDATAQCEIVPNPIDCNAFTRAVLDKPSPGVQSGQVLFSGRGDEPRKGLDDVLVAWPLVRALASTCRVDCGWPHDPPRCA
jgi:phosphatidylinositol alpha-mannosyltransferase